MVRCSCHKLADAASDRALAQVSSDKEGGRQSSYTSTQPNTLPPALASRAVTLCISPRDAMPPATRPEYVSRDNSKVPGYFLLNSAKYQRSCGALQHRHRARDSHHHPPPQPAHGSCLRQPSKSFPAKSRRRETRGSQICLMAIRHLHAQWLYVVPVSRADRQGWYCSQTYFDELVDLYGFGGDV